MDLQTIHAELVALRTEVRTYHERNIKNDADIAWLKKAIFGGFGFVLTVLAGVVRATLGAS